MINYVSNPEEHYESLGSLQSYLSTIKYLVMVERTLPWNVYNGQQEEYARFAPNSYTWAHLERPAFTKYLVNCITPDTRVLDAGCGPGRTIEHLLSLGVDPRNLAGVDMDGILIGRAKERFPQVQFIQADLSSLPFPVPENSMDIVTCNMVLLVQDDDTCQRTLRNFHRALRPNGMLLHINTHPVRMMYDKLDQYQSRGWTTQRSPWGTEIDNFHRTVADYINLTIQAGFTIMAVDEPEVNPDGRYDACNYAKYTQHPPRLVVVAKKPII